MAVAEAKALAEPSPDSEEPSTATPSTRTSPSTFERVICSNPPILDSLFAQITTQDALHLYHTSPHLRTSLRDLPTAWRFISWRLYQPLAVAPATANQNSPNASRQSSNYALDQLLINVINPYSTCLQSLELDNTAVSGGTLTQTVLILRRDTLQHLSVRGCKNVSLKYHINPWLQMHALARQGGPPGRLYPYDKLALKSLYTYRCRHHRRRPYLPSSLARKESDSEPTHELVKTCHLLGIWTDTAWCTSPGARCFRRRGYVTMRSPQDPREVWVVFDRLWRSKNWLGPIDSTNSIPHKQHRKKDPRFWEVNENARKGEAIGLVGEGKDVPMHLRASHRRFVEDVNCHQCDAPILERCEQCSIMMHCSGCRKTLCASCAFDRPYLRNKNAAEQDRNRFWWAPGYAVSPCSMQDSDIPLPVGNAPNNGAPGLPNIRFKWCCTEPVFSGGGGISFPNASNRNADAIRAAPLPRDHGWEEPDFTESDDLNCGESHQGLAGKWRSLPDFFFRSLETNEHGALQVSPPVPRMLCEDCYSSEKWRITCKACNLPLCIKHDMRDRMKVRICGFKDLSLETREYLAQKKKWDQKWEKINEQLRLIENPRNPAAVDRLQQALALSDTAPQPSPRPSPERVVSLLRQSFLPLPTEAGPSNASPQAVATSERRIDEQAQAAPELELPPRPQSRGSNCSDSISRSSSPAPSAATPPITPEPKSTPRKAAKKDIKPSLEPPWKGCYTFFCPLVRPAGDHRRRCVAVMRQCWECRINVCEECISAADEPCPCRGCKGPTNENGTPTEPHLFFCSNCRWSRMANGKCKRFTDAYLAAQAAQAGRSRRVKKQSKLRRSVETRSASNPGVAVPDEAAVLLSEFSEMRLTEAILAESAAGQNADLNRDEQGEIEEIENVGHLARELITRIQGLRGQFRPGSLAARALPDVRLMDDTQSIILNARAESDSSSDDPSNEGEG